MFFLRQCIRIKSTRFQRGFHNTQISPNPLELTSHFFNSLHVFSNTSWAVTIPLSAIILRSCITLPVTIYSKRRLQRFKSLQALRSAWVVAIRRNLVKHLHDLEQFNKVCTKHILKKMKEINRRHDCSLFKMFALPILTQVPLLFLVSFTLRGMAGLTLPIFNSSSIPLEPGFVNGGALWFENLLLPDETFFIPFAIGFLNFVNVEVTSSNREKVTKFNQITTNSLKILSIVTIPVAMQLPSALTLYWATSALYSIIQNVVLDSVYRQPNMKFGEISKENYDIKPK